MVVGLMIIPEKFNCVDDVPEFQRFENEEDRLDAINAYLKAGAIAKEDLIPGAWYIGQSRSTNIAQWFPRGGFHFPRYKIGGSFVDNIPHFFDNIDTDIFVPIKMIEI